MPYLKPQKKLQKRLQTPQWEEIKSSLQERLSQALANDSNDGVHAVQDGVVENNQPQNNLQRLEELKSKQASPTDIKTFNPNQFNNSEIEIKNDIDKNTGINPTQFEKQSSIQIGHLSPQEKMEKLKSVKSKIFEPDTYTQDIAEQSKKLPSFNKVEPIAVDNNFQNQPQFIADNSVGYPNLNQSQTPFNQQNINFKPPSDVYYQPTNNPVSSPLKTHGYNYNHNFYQADEFQQKTDNYNKNQNGRIATKQYHIRKPSDSKFRFNLDNHYKLLFTNVASYSLILIILVAGFYLTFSSSGDTSNNQVLGANEQSDSAKPIEEKTTNKPTIEINNITVPNEKNLNIKHIPAEYNLSSQAASLQMALAHYQIEVSQDEILEKIGYSTPLQPQKIGQEVIWGDPTEGFLGNINGIFGSTQTSSIEYSTGWGVDSQPVLKVAKNFLENSHILVDGSISEIKQSIANQHPVIIWHQPNTAKNESLTIKTNQGKKFELKHHTVSLITGYQETEEETVYFLNDPKQGQIKLKQSELINQWSKMNRQAIAVKKS